MKAFTTLTSLTVRLPLDDIDTDQIIPGRFLTTTSSEGLGSHLFADWRGEGLGAKTAYVDFAAPEVARRSILVAGRNFGSGSSREHAVWALMDYGFRAVIAPSLADIFRSNALKNGLLALELGVRADHLLTLAGDPEIEIDLVRQTVFYGAEVLSFQVDPFARACLLEGADALDWMIGQRTSVEAFEQGRLAGWTR